MYIVVKRIIDFLVASIMMITLSPLLIVIALLIKKDSNGPILFKQARSGKDGSVFNLYKFRSMTCDNDVLNFKTENKVTKIGKFIRSTSIDELPQLINIMKGEMSFIGPRPWITNYNEYFTEEQRHRLDVLPGITGLAQCSGRNGISIENKLILDIEYVKNISLIVDIKIIIASIKTVLKKESVDISKLGIKYELDYLKNQWLN